MDHRKGRLTASKHHDYYTKINTISKSRGEVYARTTNLVANLIFRDDNLSKIEAIKWGRVNEEAALKKFFALEATKHIDFRSECKTKVSVSISSFRSKAKTSRFALYIFC